MPADYSKLKIGEIAASVSETHKRGKPELIFLNTSDILHGKFLHRTYTPTKDWPGQAKKSIRRDDILLSEIRPANGRWAFVREDADDFVVSTKLMVIRADQRRVFPLYLYQFLTSSETSAWLQHLAESRSGTFPQITFDQVASLEIPLPPLADYAPPSPEAFRYVAVDLEMSQGAALAQAERVFILGFEALPSDLMRANREANALVRRLAELTDGLPWDAECRLLYSRAAWQERRVASWQGDLPDVRGHVNMHAYRNPDLVRIITLGMRKFGLPDLVIAQTPSGGSRAAGNAINACAQRMLEGQAFDGPRFDLVLADIRHDGMREPALANPLDGATGRARLHLAEAPWEQGDPQNRLLALEFPDGEGQTPLERQASALATLYGSEGSIVGRRPGDEALKAASEKARAAFLAKAPTFRKGLQPNERLVIKAPFTFDDQTEYMWVEVVGWRTSSIEGILMNDSHFNRKLRVGHRVTVNLRDVYDYIHYKPDGTEEGNETGKVLRGP